MRRRWMRWGRRLWIFAAIISAAVVVTGIYTVSHAPGQSGDTGAIAQRVNVLIDSLLAAGQRLLDLPLFMLLMPVALIAAGGNVLVARFSTTHTRFRIGRAALITLLITSLFAFAMVTDRHILRLQNQLNDLRTKSNNDSMTLIETLAKIDAATQATPASAPVPLPVIPPVMAAIKSVPPAAPASTLIKNDPRQALFFDQAAVRKNLSDGFTDMTLHPVILDHATDVVQIHFSNPYSQAYLAIVDLTDPGLTINIGASLSRKTYTSDFARTNACSVAINGEAGNSPAPNAGLGPWQGFLASNGNVLLREQPRNARPFLTFDTQNRAAYVSLAAPARDLASDAFNAIWGRMDAVLQNQIQTADERARQPRTAMGINQDGSKLYLLVVDGRQPRYSLGYTLAETGAVLNAFGATNAMLCDEGGSSCMYIQRFNGIVNAPADGEERPTYTHFGIHYKTSPQ